MTASEMIAALEAVKKENELEDYVDEVLEDMSEDDLYCNFRLNGDLFDFQETDKTKEFKDYREDYSIDTCVDNIVRVQFVLDPPEKSEIKGIKDLTFLSEIGIITLWSYKNKNNLISVISTINHIMK